MTDAQSTSNSVNAQPGPTDDDMRLVVAGMRKLLVTLEAANSDLQRDWSRVGDQAMAVGRDAVQQALAVANRVNRKIEDASMNRDARNE